MKTFFFAALAIASVTTVGYAGILAGPAVIGLIAQVSSLTFALACVAALLLIVTASAKAVTPPSRIRPDVPIWLDHVALKAVSLDKNQRFETAEEFLLAVERGAARPLTAPPPVPLLQRDATVIWKIGFGVSLFINVLLIYWVLFLPR